MARILVAGATGHLGKHIVAELKRRNHWVRVLTRNPMRPYPLADEVVGGNLNLIHSLNAACGEIDVIISAAGSSLDPSITRKEDDYRSVDYEGHRNLLRVAGNSGIKRFVYVSVFCTPALQHLEYVSAHTRFAEELVATRLSCAIIQPTGFFSAFDPILELASNGIAPLIGDGKAITNPIHEADLAKVCVDAMDGPSRAIPVGGPDILTRRQIYELAFRALDKKPRFIRVPGAAIAAQSRILSYFNPRVSQLMDFLQQVSVVDVVAPAYGELQLGAYFEEKVNVAAGI
ncbi:MAG: SDR family oxidoreductase [Rhodothermales bacterium]